MDSGGMRDASRVYAKKRGSSKGVKMNKYFVVVYFRREDGNYGLAASEIERESPVSGHDDIVSMVDCFLSRNPGMKEAIIINWRKFESPE
jgi:hypothetical protein